MSRRTAALWLGAYVYGSLPLVYWLGRRQRVDLRRAGSGNVGATNLLAAGSAPAAVAGWVFDASKGLLPVMVARRLGVDERAAALGGVCGVAGQCWPIFLGFRGGRGVSAFIGAAYAIDPLAWLAAVAALAGSGLWHRICITAGAQRTGRSKSVPLGGFLAFTLFALVGAWRSPAGSAAPGSLAPTLLTALLMLRRLTAPLPDDATHGPAVRTTALWYRLLYDRNTAD